jgi:hypothetical protein
MILLRVMTANLMNNKLQCSLDLPFFKGPAKTVDKYGVTGNPDNHFFLTKKVVHCLLLLGRILPQLKI